MIDIAVIGAGRIGQIHATNLHQHPDAKLRCIIDVSAAAAKALADRCETEIGTLDAMLDDTSIGAVVIASSTDTHAELVTACANAGKQIFCEKPLDLNVETAQACVAVADDKDVLLCLGFNRRHDPTFERLKSKIDSGALGDVEVVSITSRDPAPPPVEYIARSGGLFRDMMIHDFDMARWLLGEEPVEVFAAGSVLVDAAIGDAGDIDTATATLKTASGRLCLITNSRRCSYGYDQRIEVFGSTGMARAANQRETLVEMANNEGFVREPALPFFSNAMRMPIDCNSTSFCDHWLGRHCATERPRWPARARDCGCGAAIAFDRQTRAAVIFEKFFQIFHY